MEQARESVWVGVSIFVFLADTGQTSILNPEAKEILLPTFW